MGVADVDGLPHIYQCPFDAALGELREFFLVSPISPELLELVMEDWKIWMRWSEAFERGAASKETHPALPQDREHYEELKTRIGAGLVVDSDRARKLNAAFRSIHLGWDGLEVAWKEPQ